MSAREPGSGDVNDEFWGDVPDWSGTASTSRRSGRRRIGAAGDEPHDPTPIGHRRPTRAPSEPDLPRRSDPRPSGLVETLRTAWDGLIGGGPDTTREHRRVDIGAAPFDQEIDPFADHEVDGVDHEIDPFADGDRSDLARPGPGDSTDGRRTSNRPVAPVTRAGVGIDPLLARLGAVVIVACLLVPMLIAVMRSNELNDSTVGAIASASSEFDAAVIPAPTAAPVADPTPSSTAPLDPASLPPAVPVNTAESVPTASADSVIESTSADVADDAADGSIETVAAPVDSTAGESTAASQSNSRGVSEVVEPASAAGNAARVDPPVCPVPYRVVDGDFWLRLADAADVELADLLAVNRATVNTPLYPGDEICLPEGATTPEPPAPATTTTTTQPPTATTTTTTTTTTTPPTEPPGPEEIKQIVRDVWPDDLEDRALEIVYRESRFVPTAKNFCCYGLFQIYWEVHDVWLVDLGITSANQLYDPETNARAALALYERAGGWGPWGF